MRRLTLLLTLALPTLLWTGCADHTPPLQPTDTELLAAAGGPHVVQVAPPTGDVATDRASILAALAQVREGGTVQFAPGTYVIGVPAAPARWEYLDVTVPRVTLLGHPAGTTLRGCDPAEITFGRCVGLLLSGGHQVVRNLSFVDMYHALQLGIRPTASGELSGIGGYMVENNVFRNSTLGVAAVGQWPQPALIRGNTFVNMYAAVLVYGRTAHVLDNDISAPEPELVPFWYMSAVGIFISDILVNAPCDHNVFARNRVDGYQEGIGIYVAVAGCRHNAIRHNTILNSPLLDPSYPATPIYLWNETGDEDLLAHNSIEGNQAHGSVGMGIQVGGARQSRIVNNTITGITLMEDFPEWVGEGNGSGVWIGPGSRENQILSNSFAAIASHGVVLEGDYNHVATRSRSDVVRDLGVGNRITGPGSVINFAAPAARAFSAAPAAVEHTPAARRLRQRLGVDAW